MKKLFILPILAVTLCSSSSAWAMDRILENQGVAPSSSSKSFYEDFSQAYPQTMKGSKVGGANPFHDPNLLIALREASRQKEIAPETHETLKIIAEYYEPILTQYMQSLQEYAKKNGKTSSEFEKLWEQINTDNRNLFNGNSFLPLSYSTLEVAAVRCCHLASFLVANPDSVAESIFSHNNFSSDWVALFKASEAPTPSLFGKTQNIPAWKHSIFACAVNCNYLQQGILSGQKYTDTFLPSIGYAGIDASTSLHANDSIHDCIRRHQGSFWFAPVQVPLIMEGAFGLTHMVEAILQNIVCIPLALKQASVHTVKFSPHHMALHDLLHADLDPREDAMYQEILDRLADFKNAGGYVLDGVQPTVEFVEKRCQKLHETLLECVNTQKKIFLASIHSDPDTIDNARKHYNTFISGLALVFHELYSFSEKTLKALTFEEAMDSLKPTTSFGPLFEADLNDDLDVETPQHIWSDLSDEEIIQGVKTKFSENQTREGAKDWVEARDWGISRTPLAIYIEAHSYSTGDELTHEITTLRGLRTIYEDLNGYLKPSGNNIEVPNLRDLSYPEQLTAMHSFAEQVRGKTRSLVDTCIEIINETSNTVAYNSFVEEQEMSWSGLKQAIVVPEEIERNLPRLPISASSATDDGN
jgi:hypothetical protein